MSGTSLDGVDGVLVDFSRPEARVLAHSAQPLPAALRQDLLALNARGHDELHRAALAGNALVLCYAEVVAQLLAQTGLAAADIRAIGAHGQTVRHQPQAHDGVGYTLQLNQPALLAERCAITVVADFRTRDLAAGGQGAPLVPPFHQAFFGPRWPGAAVLNIGGISNVTLLPADAQAALIGFDCGPGNALLDSWCQQHLGQPFDRDGAWAASGKVRSDVLQCFLDDPFFQQSGPKSTGRDRFHPEWLQSRLERCAPCVAQDVQATLAELTALCCARAVQSRALPVSHAIVCGGGALNHHVMLRLRALLAPCTVLSSQEAGLPPLQVEACAFAWLAKQCLDKNAASVPSVTGARGARILGAVYAA